MDISILSYKGAPDLLMTVNGDQIRFTYMRCLQFTGAQYTANCARFISEYTNRDGTVGLPPVHIGATSPYITDNMIFLFFNDNAQDAFVQAEIDAANAQGAGTTLAAAEATRLAAVAANATLVASVTTERGWRN